MGKPYLSPKPSPAHPWLVPSLAPVGAGGGRRLLRRGHAPVCLPGCRLVLARPGISSLRPHLSIPSVGSNGGTREEEEIREEGESRR